MMQTKFLLSLSRLNEMQMLSFSLSMRNVNSPARHREMCEWGEFAESLFSHATKPISRLSKYLQIIQFNGSSARQVNLSSTNVNLLAIQMQIAQLYGSL